MWPGPMALAGLGPSFGQRDWACRPQCKVEVQDPNGSGDPMSYILFFNLFNFFWFCLIVKFYPIAL